MIGKIPLFDADDEAPRDGWSKWGLGIGFPSVIFAIGASCVVFTKATLIGHRGRTMPLAGWDAIAAGIFVMAIALYLHVHYFWSNSERLAEYEELGKIVALLAGIVALGFVFARNFTLI